MRACRRAGPGLQRQIPPGRRGLPRRAWIARVVPRRAVLPVRDRRARPAPPCGDPPRAVAAAGGGRRDRARLDLPARARRRAALPLLAPAGRARLAARARALASLANTLRP